MPIDFLFYVITHWLVDHGIELALLILLAFLVPRVGRFIMRFVAARFEHSDQDRKANLALAGAAVYIGQGVAYFLLLMAFLKQLGFSPVGAAVPATVISAALGFGAQTLIGDFLAGFFIITEKQYGIGDWVQFEGNGVSVEGDVMQITMRATKIRTLNGENVTIPNGTARVCINYSNHWARAVANLPIPLLTSSSVEAAIKRGEAAARRALAYPEIRKDLIGDLEIHPAVDIVRPTAVGLPWIMTTRFIIQVSPARQWAVERAIRMEVLQEFWEEYGSAATTAGTRVSRVLDDESERPRGHQGIDDRMLTDGSTSTKRECTDAQSVEQVSEKAGDSTQTTHPTTGSYVAATPGSVEIPVAEIVDEPTPTVFRTDHYKRAWKRGLSLGGRIRISTTLLLLSTFGLILAKGLTVEPSETWLDDHPPAPAASTTSPTPTSPLTTTPETTTTSSPRESSRPSSTTTTRPNGETSTPTSTSPTTSTETTPEVADPTPETPTATTDESTPNRTVE